MALGIGKGKNLPIGVDLGSSRVKMVQVRQVDQGLELVAAASAEIPRPNPSQPKHPQGLAGAAEESASQDECVSRALRMLAKSSVFTSCRSVLSIPARSTFVQHIKIPKLPPQEVPNALQWELQGKLPYPVENAIIRHIIAGDVFSDGQTKQEVIVVSANRATVEKYLTIARRAKLDVIAINVEACAIVDCFARLFSQPADFSRATLYVDIGAASTQAVISHGDKIVFARNLATGGDDLDGVVSTALRVPPEEACALRRDLARGVERDVDEEMVYRLLETPLNELGEQLTQCLRYHESVFRNQAVERVIFLGGQAYDKRLCQAIAQRLNLPAQIGDPLVNVSRTSAATLSTGLERCEPQPDWAVAVGLSLGAHKAA